MTTRIADDFGAIRQRMNELAGVRPSPTVGQDGPELLPVKPKWRYADVGPSGTVGTPCDQRSTLRDIPLSEDRRWIIHTLTFSAVITEHMGELTGFDPRLAELEPKYFVFGGNVGYIRKILCRDWGWTYDPLITPERCPSAGT